MRWRRNQNPLVFRVKPRLRLLLRIQPLTGAASNLRNRAHFVMDRTLPADEPQT
jgi:hypothetical protein